MELPAVAFKEWAAVVLALERGRQDIILRRGGIAEDGDGFRLDHRAFLLFPTWFHQQRTGVRPEHRDLVDEALASEPPPDRLRIASWAEVVEATRVEDEAALEALAGRHVYTAEVARARLHARHGEALWAIAVRVHRLPSPLDLPLLPAYGGCRSWVRLQGIGPNDSAPGGVRP